jgi:glycosyltransferase involved in cell wall biosynthesis
MLGGGARSPRSRRRRPARAAWLLVLLAAIVVVSVLLLVRSDAAMTTTTAAAAAATAASAATSNSKQRKRAKKKGRRGEASSEEYAQLSRLFARAARPSSVVVDDATTTPSNTNDARRETAASSQTAARPPLVSIIVASYNAALYIVECLDSVLAQTYTSWEIIVVDDQSSDGTGDLVRAYIHAHAARRIRFVEVRHTSTPAATRNAGVRLALADWIVMLDGDDKLPNDALMVQVNALIEQPNANVVVGGMTLFGDFSFVDAIGAYPGHKWQCEPYTPAALLKRNLIHNSAMFRRSVWRAAGGYSEVTPHAEDWLYWLQAERGLAAAAAAGVNRGSSTVAAGLRVVCLSSPTVLYRQKKQSRNTDGMSSQVRSITHVDYVYYSSPCLCHQTLTHSFASLFLTSLSLSLGGGGGAHLHYALVCLRRRDDCKGAPRSNAAAGDAEQEIRRHYCACAAQRRRVFLARPAGMMS